MLRFIATVLLMFFILAVLSVIGFYSSLSLRSKEINKALDTCYDNNNQLLWDNINKMNKGNVNKEESCHMWKNSIEDIEDCTKKAFGIPIYLDITQYLPIEQFQTIRKNKEKQATKCKEYPETMVK